MKLLIKFFNLSTSDKRLLVRTAFIVGAIRIGLSVFSFATVNRMIERRRRRDIRKQNRDDALVEKIAWSVRVASRYIPAATCLTQAFSAMTLMKQFGQAASLRIGVALSAGGHLEAHAWVENSGRIIIGDTADLSRYTVLSPLEKVNPNERDLRYPAS